jgi:hypothetical protein
MMKRILFGSLVLLAACEEGASFSNGPAASGGMREQLVIGSNMSFEQCQSRGGLIIQDRGSPMIACDPHVIRAPAPTDEFDNPAANAG